MTLRTMPVAATVIGDLRVRTVLAAQNMPAESHRAAALDRRHHLQLAEAHVAGIGFTPSGPVVAEDVRNLQRWTGHERRALCGRLVLLGLQAETLQRAHDRADGVGGDVRIERRRFDLRMSEQNLNHSDVGVLLQKMGGKTVPQRVRRHALGDLRHIGCRMAGPVELACRHRLQRIAAWEQPSLWPRNAPPVAQQFEQHGGEHRVTIPAALALLDPQHHALAVDVGHLQRGNLGYAQARTIGGAERGLVLDAGGGLQKARHLLGAQHHRQLARLVHKGQVSNRIGAVERHSEEEPQRRDRGVDGRRTDTVLGQVQLEQTQVLIGRCVR